MKLSDKDKELIKKLSNTKTVRELAKAFLGNITIEEIANLVSTYLVLKSKNKEDETFNVFLKEQFFSLLKTLLVSLADIFPEFITDAEFMKYYSKIFRKG